MTTRREEIEIRRAYIEEYYENARKERIKKQNTPIEISKYHNSAPRSNYIVGSHDGLYNSSKA